MLLLSLSALASGGKKDSLALRVGSRNVSRAEFEAAYRQHAAGRKETPEAFARRYADFLLLVETARAEGADTLPALRRETERFRRELLRARRTVAPADEAAARELYARMKERYGAGQVRVAQLVRYLPQRIPTDEWRKAEALMDSLHRAISRGASFEECLRRYSDQREPLWTGSLQMPEEWEEKVFPLSPGEISAPFSTPQGIYIVKMLERKEVPAYGEVREELLKRVFRRTSGTGIGPQQTEAECPSAWPPEVLREVGEQTRLHRDSCLVRLYAESLSARISTDEAALQRYFAGHPSEFRWPEPRYRGIVLRCADKRTGKRLKRLFKSLPAAEWEKALRFTLRQDSTLRVEYRIGTFAPGDHPDVDRLVFKLKATGNRSEAASSTRLPHALCIGRKEKAPTDWTEVREELAGKLCEAELRRRVEERRKTVEVEFY